MTEPVPVKKLPDDKRPPPRPDPIPGMGRPEVSKGVFGDLFKRFRKRSLDHIYRP